MLGEHVGVIDGLCDGLKLGNSDGIVVGVNVGTCDGVVVVGDAVGVLVVGAADGPNDDDTLP